MANGKEHWRSLRELFRWADYRPFRAQDRNGRWANFLGVGPTGAIVGWWDGQDSVEQFDKDQLNWSNGLRLLGGGQ